MQATAIHDTATTSDTTSAANELTTMTQETGRELRDRLKLEPRTIQRAWLRLFGESFDVNRVCTFEEVAAIESEYLSEKEKNKRAKAVRKIEAGVSPGQKVVPVIPFKNRWRTTCLFLAFLAPTVASVSTTFMVSHAMSGNTTTSVAITLVASSTSILFLWAGVHSVGSWFVVAATLGFEGFCNSASVFKWLMGDLAYGLTTVSGKPSEFLAMVANFTGKDHQDVATWMACFTAAMICGAQVSSIYELKK